MHLISIASLLRFYSIRMYDAVINIFNNEGRCHVLIKTEAIDGGNVRHYYPGEFFECWDIVSRRVLIEKTVVFKNYASFETFQYLLRFKDI